RKALDLELASVLGVRRPDAFEAQRLADVGAEQAADDGDGLTLAFGHKTRDCVAVLVVRVGEALDAAVQDFHGYEDCKDGLRPILTIILYESAGAITEDEHGAGGGAADDGDAEQVLEGHNAKE